MELIQGTRRVVLINIVGNHSRALREKIAKIADDNECISNVDWTHNEQGREEIEIRVHYDIHQNHVVTGIQIVVNEFMNANVTLMIPATVSVSVNETIDYWVR